MGSFSIWHWLVVLMILGLFLIPLTFYLLTLQRAFEAIDADLRPINPGLVWLFFIPLFNIIWAFFLVVYLKTGYEAMSDASRTSRKTSAGFGVGLAFAICSAASLVPGLNLLTFIPALVLWILHWVQVDAARKLVLARAPTASF